MSKMTQSEAGRLGWEKGQKWRTEQKEKRLAEYAKNPTKCGFCGEKFTYEKRTNKYCNRSCAASKNNLGVARNIKNYAIKKLQDGRIRYYKKENKCEFCGKTTSNSKYCGSECHREHIWQKLKADIEQSGFNNLGPYSKIRKRYLIETKGYICEICGVSEWMKQPVSLILDHINGNSEDNSIANLRLICPNCDAQTPTYKGRNRGNGRHYRRQRYANGQSY